MASGFLKATEFLIYKGKVFIGSFGCRNECYLAFQCAGEGVGQTRVCVGAGQAHAQAVTGFSDACLGETGRRGAFFAGRGQEDDGGEAGKTKEQCGYLK